MSEAKHTPEHWKIAYEKGSIYIEDVETGFNQVVVFKYGQMEEKDEANAARIVECVNALAGIENPREWVEEYKTMESLHKSSSHDIRMLTNENLKLKDTIVRGDRIMVENAHEIAKLQAEIKKAKAEAWNEGFIAGKSYVEENMSVDHHVPARKNPYKKMKK